MNKLIKILPLLATGVALVGCQDEDFGYTAKEIAYQTAFTKAFGKIDPEQDFSFASRANVTVTPGKNQEIKIYAKSSGNWKLVGHYTDVTGTRVLGADVKTGTEELMVSDGISAYSVKVGGSVNFSHALTRTGSLDDTNSSSFVKHWLNEGPVWPYYYFDNTEALAYKTVLPELNVSSTYPTKGNLTKFGITKDFTYVSTGTFIVYPMYWATSSSDQVGLYYTDASDQIVKIPLMNNGGGNESLQGKNSSGVWQTISNLSGNGTVADNTWVTEWRSKGIVVDIPVGTVFGFYLSFSTTTHYSDAQLNGDVNWAKDQNATDIETEKACYCASYYDSKGDLVLGMEDWHDGGETNSHSDFDLNDLMFKFGGNTPIVVDNSTDAWMLAYEDLGGSFDWDFNDIILRFEYVSGENTAKITPVAAGGTLHSTVCFKETPESDEQVLGEIHVLMGETARAENTLYDPINASSRGKEGAPVAVTISDPSNFSIENWGEAMAETDITTALSACGVYLKTKSVNESVGTNTVIAYQGAGKVPELLILPETYEKDGLSYVWAWPTENTDIRNAYKGTKKFDTWVKDHSSDGDWFMYPTPQYGDVVEAKFSMVGKEDNTLVPEYSLSEYGDAVEIPTPDNKVYDFSDMISELPDDGGVVILTFAAKGGIKIGTTSWGANLGTWTDIDGNAVATNDVVSLAANTEGVYHATLSALDLATIKAANSFLVVSGNELLQMSIKNTNGCPLSIASSAVISTGDNAYTINVPYTTSSTGVVSISPAAQSGVSATINPSTKVITFTATESTAAGNYTFSVSQAADENYAAGSKDITITVSTLRSSQLAITSGTPVAKLTEKGATATITYTTLSSGAITVNQPECATVTVDEVNKTVTVTAKKTGNATITISQAEVTDQYSAGTASFDIEVEIALSDFPSGIQTLDVKDATSQYTTGSDFGWAIGNSGKVFEVTVGEYNIPVGKTGVITIVADNNNAQDLYLNKDTKWNGVSGEGGYSTTHTYSLSEDQVSQLFANGKFFTAWYNNVSSVKLELTDVQ